MDIFDRIMLLPILRKFNGIYTKNKEILLYLFFGGCTFLVSIGTYALFSIVFHINILWANVFSWVLAVLFAYLTNRKWVFKSNVSTAHELVKEISSFLGGRVLTLVIEEAMLYVFITKLCFSSMVIKIVAQVVVIFLNYIISKLFVFG